VGLLEIIFKFGGSTKIICIFGGHIVLLVGPQFLLYFGGPIVLLVGPSLV
jgi:hypothetical protein